jgi:hypothetical protein
MEKPGHFLGVCSVQFYGDHSVLLVGQGAEKEQFQVTPKAMGL